jgi:hypothetical protein
MPFEPILYEFRKTCTVSVFWNCAHPNHRVILLVNGTPSERAISNFSLTRFVSTDTIGFVIDILWSAFRARLIARRRTSGFI